MVTLQSTYMLMEAGLGYLSSKILKALEFGLKNEYLTKFSKSLKKPPLERAAWVNKQLLGVPIAVTSRDDLPIKLHFGLGRFARYGELSNQTPLSLLLHHYPLQ